MGIEVTSEAWEACFRHSKTPQIGGNVTFFEILNEGDSSCQLGMRGARKQAQHQPSCSLNVSLMFAKPTSSAVRREMLS
jgi:hypothetical protein